MSIFEIFRLYFLTLSFHVVLGMAILLAVGSNGGNQLGIGHGEDAHTWQECQYDQGTFPPVGYHVVQLSSGSNHAVALLAHNTDMEANVQLWGSGSGKEGQLGNQSEGSKIFQRLDVDPGSFEMEREKPSQWRPVRVACGWNSTFVVLRSQSDGNADDVILVMGKENDFGQLGMGKVKKVDEGGGVVQIFSVRQEECPLRIMNMACGLRHTVIMCKRGNRMQVIGWGAARHGQLDAQQMDKYPSTYWTPHLLDEWEVEEAPSHRQGYLAAGKEHSIYCGKDNTLQIIGSNRQGQRRVASFVFVKEILSAACTWNATLILLKGSIVGSGNNSKGQLGGFIEQDGFIEAKLDQVLQGRQDLQKQIPLLTCGSEHSMILVSKGDTQEGGQGEVWGWGWNEHGNLAQGDQLDQEEPVLLWPSNHHSSVYQNATATDIWAGCGTSFIQIQHVR